jgi:glycosyltransferase involved in cell wall biosynthesis
LRKAEGNSRIVRKLSHAQSIVKNIRVLARHIREHKFSHVLFASYFEYLAPLWASSLERLANDGVVFGAVVHDPVRDFVLGPHWWHRWSIARGYSFLREAFVHEPIDLDTVRPMPRLRTTVIPHGVYSFPDATETRDAARARLGIPPGSHVMLSFGHIRDGKNLDLVLHAMRQFPDLHLLVAGAAQSSGQKPAEFYQNLAREFGVADRCHWKIGYVNNSETGNLFAASDVALITYSRAFRSASGVLNAAVFFRKPCIASAGQGNLSTMVQKFDLGVWVEPDNADALARGIDRWMISPPKPRWDDYCSENSWQRNAEIVLRQMK